MTDRSRIKYLCEAALMSADEPLDLEQLLGLWTDEPNAPQRQELREALAELQQDYAERGVELREVGSGFRFQTRREFAAQLNKLWDSRAPRYSRALLETLAIIAYRQPVTRGEIEAIRGVAVNTNIIRTLLEREWIHVTGQRDVPGRPSLYATTREFLDYFNLRSLGELPKLAELRDIDDLNRDLFAEDPLQLLAQTEESEGGLLPDVDAADSDGEVDVVASDGDGPGGDPAAEPVAVP
ncbi:MAG: SMC-Scp complex subunit ScpB [Gammaproteobacteria bacterium]|nr:SMC-Scp complex subunit ScpB [Gammaproteobacteria bacterium]